MSVRVCPAADFTTKIESPEKWWQVSQKSQGKYYLCLCESVCMCVVCVCLCGDASFCVSKANLTVDGWFRRFIFPPIFYLYYSIIFCLIIIIINEPQMNSKLSWGMMTFFPHVSWCLRTCTIFKCLILEELKYLGKKKQKQNTTRVDNKLKSVILRIDGSRQSQCLVPFSSLNTISTIHISNVNSKKETLGAFVCICTDGGMISMYRGKIWNINWHQTIVPNLSGKHVCHCIFFWPIRPFLYTRVYIHTYTHTALTFEYKHKLLGNTAGSNATISRSSFVLSIYYTLINQMYARLREKAR